jgi:hypothetical protein
MNRESGKPRRLLAAGLSWLIPVLGLTVGLGVSARPAEALPLKVKVTVVSIQDVSGDLDGGVEGIEADFYGRVFIDGQEFAIPQKDDDDLYEVNLTFEKDFEHTRQNVPVQIRVGEDDGNVFNGADDQVDIDPNPGDDFLDLTVDLHGGCVTGDVTGGCNVNLEASGDRSEWAKIIFKVEVSLPPTNVANSHVRCTHTPAWPQPGNTVTFTAESLGDQPASLAVAQPAPATNANLAAPMPAQLAPKVEVWLTTDAGSTRTVIGSGVNVPTQTATTVAGAAGTTLSYGCRVETAGGPIFSGWRSTTVGNPPTGNVVSISVGEADQTKALDILLVPATRNPLNNPFNAANGTQAGTPYTGPSDPTFLNEATRILQQEIWRHQVLLDEQRATNLWLLLDQGQAVNRAAVGGFRDLLFNSGANAGTVTPDANADNIPDGDGTADTCHVELPGNLATDGAFANATAIVHNNAIRDCAPGGGSFTSEQNELNLFPHELGHAGFGMADEYCCDGGYFQPNPNPNTYLSAAACTADETPLGYATGACNGYDRVNENPQDAVNDFWVADPSDNDPFDNDLMNNNQTPQAGDIRRIRWLLQTQCPAKSC